MLIELLDAYGQKITLIDSEDPQHEFEEFFKMMYKASGWREYQKPVKTQTELRNELKNLVVSRKKEIAYGGYAFTKDGKQYVTSTAENDIGKITLALMTAAENVNWQVYTIDGDRAYLNFTKNEFIALVSAGHVFVNAQFEKEAQFLAELEAKSELTEEFIAEFKVRIQAW